MKQINLSPWRQQQNKLKKRQFIIGLMCILSVCITLLFFTKLLIDHQIKFYQFSSEKVLFHIKGLSYTTQEVKRLKQEEKELKEIINVSEENHQQIRKILDFLIHLKTISTPDLFIRIIEYHHPYLNLVMSADSKMQVLTLIKTIQLKYYQKIQWNFINNSKDKPFEFVIKNKI
jgi:hypothetical protein